MPSRGNRIGVVALAGVLLGASPSTTPGARDLVVVRDGQPHTIRLGAERGFPAAPLSAIAGALGYNLNGTVLQVEGVGVHFFDDSPFFTLGGVVHQLPNQSYRNGPLLMVPASWALEWLPRAFPHRWRYMDGRLVESDGVATSRDREGPWLVVIDAGHGGRDPGAVGVKGTKEKDVTLAVARGLQRRLEQERDIEVFMTRSTDTLVALDDRPRLPQMRGVERQPDLFISIHANSMPKKPNSANGFETYFLAVAKTEQARQVAMRENSSIQFEGRALSAEALDPLQFVLSDLQSTGNLRESSLFASSVNRSMDVTLNVPDHGVKQAPFTVLISATMPAALVEIGYLSNSREERLLRSSSHQAKIADALADGIVNYLAGYGQRIWSSSQAGG